MPRYTRSEARLIHGATGEEIRPETECETFRGKTVVFRYVSRLPGGPSQGKIVIRERFLNLHNVTKEVESEVYPSVVGARIEVQEDRPNPWPVTDHNIV